MSEGLQFLADISQVMALLIAIAAFAIQLLAWLNPNARPSLAPWFRVIRRFLPYIMVAAVFFLLGTRVAPLLKQRSQFSGCQDYGIKIVSPSNGTTVQDWFTVSGTYANKPVEDSILLFLIAPNGDYSPQEKVKIDPVAKTWFATAHLDAPKEGTVMVAIAGSSGQVLYDYYWRAGTMTGQWLPFTKLTDDIFLTSPQNNTNMQLKLLHALPTACFGLLKT